jgi:hypothetical protein
MIAVILQIPDSRTQDDFGQPIRREEGEALYDAKTSGGPWALMTEASWKYHRASARLGIGRGQKYVYKDGKYQKDVAASR